MSVKWQLISVRSKAEHSICSEIMCFLPQPRPYPGSWSEVLGSTPEAHQLWTTDTFPVRQNSICRPHPSSHSLSMHEFPLEHLLPRLLVVLVVDSNDMGNVSLLSVCILPVPALLNSEKSSSQCQLAARLPQHSIEEHLL